VTNSGRLIRSKQSALCMDTVIQISVVAVPEQDAELMAAIDRAFRLFRHVEQICSRFSPDSEVSLLSKRVGVPVQVSELLFQAIRFAYMMADASDGAFDPTVGKLMESYGFNRHYLSMARMDYVMDSLEPVSYRDLEINEEQGTIKLLKPLVIDLGAVAKGLAVDLAAKELASFQGFIVDAGGDIYAGGHNEREECWTIGIRHPLQTEDIISSIQLTDSAVCTSGSYERKSPTRANTHHLIDMASGMSPSDLLSCSVVAPHAMMADAMSTAAFILGWQKGLNFLEEAGLDGIFIETNLNMHMTDPIARQLR
jgi:thiamine biosynthesis lipoprotein